MQLHNRISIATLKELLKTNQFGNTIISLFDSNDTFDFNRFL